ncbi:MAG: type III-A CRISPR-associated RAMP protein Csm3 [Candidatus Jacksonbacteria bacterium RIFOXYC2_FULL_44_29]|nr:MAG: CRISPR-associated RAMP protein Csm3 family [Parcubacteria group bacterium GW2011_GWA2_42_28]KKT54730.1 MAG: CRISPR-associated RAMP protein Csm3 family [Parcubacteria group bacterium GW2011_GWC2_44_22]OGY75328.1 MAG: type III-A CRISPR-associated RAMP protein Csm3 [Candidatus Jacksonbacteria bacterium RIFOXYA2_FULL_43_12]OGY76238.1 MAG: type III-A CRISPR-associated RAMP protein Csm3 [Candidatus Jacksonbacteria bacterium RIFOXYB2_FULL_44_15]OGY78093.1 MAG: type III-A CRISPR-associated RAMP
MFGTVEITGNLVAKTGILIGGNGQRLGRGPVDKEIIRDPNTGMPYLPGSSLRGKIRFLVEKTLGAPANKRVANSMIHTCTQSPACSVCLLFGVDANNSSGAGKSRIDVMDSFLNPDSENIILSKDTDGIGTEYKTEAVLDRVTSAATPRTNERVIAGAIFDFEANYHLQGVEDRTLLKIFLGGMLAIEDYGIGAATSRGYGQVTLENLAIVFHSRAYYLGEEQPIVLIEAPTIGDIVKSYDEWINQVPWNDTNNETVFEVHNNAEEVK